MDVNGRFCVVAVDGGVGTGKTSILGSLSKEFGWPYLNGGLIYRGIAYACCLQKCNPLVAEDVYGLCREGLVEVEMKDLRTRVRLSGVDITDELRLPSVSRAVSHTSSHPPVRDWVRRKHHDIVNALRGSYDGVLVDGRDVTTSIFPDADVRILLCASREAVEPRRDEGDAPERDDLDSAFSEFLSPARGVKCVDTGSTPFEEARDRVRDWVLAARSG